MLYILNNLNFISMRKFLKVGNVVSSKMKERYSDSYFLDEEYDFAIVGIDYVSDSVIYSLTSLVENLMIEILKDGSIDEFEDIEDAYISCLDNFYFQFGALNKMQDFVPPTLLFDIEDEFKTAS
jgi:hypothetical protein